MPKPRKTKAPVEGELTSKDLDEISGGLTLTRSPIPVIPQNILWGRDVPTSPYVGSTPASTPGSVTEAPG